MSYHICFTIVLMYVPVEYEENRTGERQFLSCAFCLSLPFPRSLSSPSGFVALSCNSLLSCSTRAFSVPSQLPSLCMTAVVLYKRNLLVHIKRKHARPKDCRAAVHILKQALNYWSTPYLWHMIYIHQHWKRKHRGTTTPRWGGKKDGVSVKLTRLGHKAITLPSQMK